MTDDPRWWLKTNPNSPTILIPDLILPGHSKEDSERILAFNMRRMKRRRRKHQDMMCRKGSHGFNTLTVVGGGRIHTRCTHCGRSWSTVDVPVM